MLSENIQFWRFVSANNIHNFEFRSWRCFARNLEGVCSRELEILGSELL
jgi:hypothetical protein